MKSELAKTALYAAGAVALVAGASYVEPDAYKAESFPTPARSCSRPSAT